MYSFSQIFMSNQEEIVQILKMLQQSKIMLCLWQKEEDTGVERIVATAQVKKFNVSADLIELIATFNHFTFKAAPPVYVFIDGVHLLCKFNIRELGDTNLKVYFPAHIGKVFTPEDKKIFGERLEQMTDLQIICESLEVLADSGKGIRDRAYTKSDLDQTVQKLAEIGPLLETETERLHAGEENFADETFSLDDLLAGAETEINDVDINTEKNTSDDEIEVDDEEKYKAMRATPRATPKGFKTVTLVKENGATEKEYVLYDLSQGGMAFNTWLAGEFKKDDIIIVSKVGSKFLSPKMRGIVRSVRKVSENSEELKVGIQFQ